jgi:hypothetical protein
MLGILCIMSLDLRTEEVMQEKRQNKKDVPHVCSTHFGGVFPIVHDEFEYPPTPFR